MSTIAVNRRSYENTNTDRVSFTEKIRKYFRENRTVIVAGLLSMNGNVAEAAQVYRMMK